VDGLSSVVAGFAARHRSGDCRRAGLEILPPDINESVRGFDVPPKNRLQCTHVSNEEAVPGNNDQTRLREFGVGAQILKDLGLSRLRLLTNNPKKIVGLESYSLEVVEQIPLTLTAEPVRRVAARRPPRPRKTSTP